MTGYTMEWSIKDSLVDYVTSLSDGEVLTDGDVHADGKTFVFAGVADSNFDMGQSEGTISFAGCVTLVGHHGMMRICLFSPRLELQGPQGQLRVDSTKGSGKADVLFASLARAQSPDSDPDSLEFEVRVTHGGASLLGGQYPAGTQLASLKITRG